MMFENKNKGSGNTWNDLCDFINDLEFESKNALIMTHRNPDPDSIASAWGLKELLLSKGIKSTVSFSGSIVRPENRSMVDALKIEMVHIHDIVFDDFSIIALVDTQPGTGNNDLPDNIYPHIVIDHHSHGSEKKSGIYSDIRDKTGATSTIITEYIIKSGVPLSNKLATALYYGIITDTMDFSRDHYEKDVLAAQFLYSRILLKILAEIKNPVVTLSYFTEYIASFKSALKCENIVTVDAGLVSTPDILAQIVDVIIRVEGIQWVIAVGNSDSIVNFSIRSDFRGRQAGLLAQKIVKGIGTAGGHDMTAGGQVKLEGDKPKNIKTKIISLFMKEFGKDINNLENIF